MLRQKFLAPERFYECAVCGEAISNPLCPSCLATQIEVWLSQYPDKNKILKQIKGYAKEADNLPKEHIRCISCGKPIASLCPYCFTEYVLKVLKKLKVNEIILKEFLQFFNYDFEHNGYSKEAEELGVI